MFNLELTSNNKIKVTYLGTDPLEAQISILLSTIRIPVETHIFHFQNKNHWFIPSFDFTGCSFLKIKYQQNGKTKSIEYFIPPTSYKKPTTKSTNVICLGLNKTGTTSLKSGLEKLGYNVMWEALGHQFYQADVWNGDYSSLSSIIKNPRFNAYEDLPFSMKGIYKEIYKIDPNAKYILTVRDVDKWVKSVIKFYGWYLKTLPASQLDAPRFYKHHYLGDGTYSSQNWNKPMFESWGITSTENLEERLKDVYNSHVEEVTNFFKDKGDLMVLDVSKPNSFKQMADWLGENTNELDFPWLKKSN
jgi:hypothetical protein